MTTRQCLLPGVALAVALIVGTSMLTSEAQEPHERKSRADAALTANVGNLAERRDELTRMAQKTIAELGRRDPTAKTLLDRAHGWAVLDTTTGGFIMTGAGGTGLAKAKTGNEAVFMHVGGADVAGGGAASYKLVLLFDNARAFDELVDGKWHADASVDAVGGDAAPPAEHGFRDGVVAYRVDTSGRIAQVELKGLRFWPSDRLNEIP